MKQKTIIRLVILAAIMVALALVAAYTPLGKYFNLVTVQTTIQDAGIWGVLIFLIIFVVGTLLNIPGLLFMVVGYLVYGLFYGALVGYAGAFLSVFVHFMVIRTIGGSPLAEIKNKTVQRIMQGFDKRPIRTVFLLRAFLFVSPPLNYMLALSDLKTRDYAIGTALGIISPILFQVGVMYFAQDWLIDKFI